MIQKLKREFIAVNMLIILLVIIPTFMYIQYNLKTSLAHDSYMAIEEGLKRFGNAAPGFNPDDIKPKEYILPNKYDGLPDANNNFFNTFYVTLNEELDIVDTFSRSNFVIADEDLSTIVNRVLENEGSDGDDRGVLKDLNFRYIIKKYSKVEDTGNEVEYITIGLMDISYENMVLSSQRDTFIVIALLMIIVFFGISVFLSNMIIKPIEKSWKQQQQFVSDVSHELKTPTAVILANTSILKMNPDLGEDMKWVDYIEIEAKRMKKLVEDLLFLSKSDYSKMEQMMSSFSFSDVVVNTTLPFEAVLFESEKGVELETEIDEDCRIIGDENQMKQLVTILLDNALKYSLDNSKVKITLTKDTSKGNVVLKVNNMSEVIAKEDLEHLFDRFYKVDKARTREGNSYGLGLSIAQEIVNSHKGKISVKSNEVDGTTFKIILPIDKN